MGGHLTRETLQIVPSMKAPPKRKGNLENPGITAPAATPSMKAPPKRKGNVSRTVAGVYLNPQ